MEVINDTDACPQLDSGTVVTIGAYDGVHVGHRTVINEVKKMADAAGRPTALVTFDRHPASVVRPESAPLLLTDLDQKLELLGETGVDYVMVVSFDEDRAAESARDFVTSILVDCLQASCVVVGSDFHFGYKRRGNVETLTKMGVEHGFEVDGLKLVAVDGSPAQNGDRVSSTLVRSLLDGGHLARANQFLGRYHEVRGVVARGDARGRELGFPTANVSVSESIQLPADGIYAGWYERPDGSKHPAALSLGRRPTIYENQPYRLLEAHLLDFDDDLYDEQARVSFVEWLRGEIKFASLDELVTQIGLDCVSARDILGV
ncbi:MAG: bifunctional riboflavin kinase/FAD synthetase [Actinomycetia bacterium]|nr:bifunctional riboflavin kinase/FAD synthetase [Actinomycetes bacterium]MCP3909371.1 bifunctional riboflavin kinase/FAD synthetase [Actinomycetes bacterium]MCP4087630.1 bifunctional riboflavin kinase/FAD synthetase [Actinomycetes bacterium]